MVGSRPHSPTLRVEVLAGRDAGSVLFGSAVLRPRALHPDILVCGTAHPRLGPPCWMLALPLDSVASSALPRCGWRRCCNPHHADPALFTTRTQPAVTGHASMRV